MKYTNEQLKEKILEMMQSSQMQDAWPREVLALLKKHVGEDWSEEIAEGKRAADLDARATKAFAYTTKEQITKAEFLLFGKKGSEGLLKEFVPQITWTRYGEEDAVEKEESFGLPLIFAADKLCRKIKNTVYTYETEQLSLFPEQSEQYDLNAIKMLLYYFIGYADYQHPGTIQVKEFKERLEFIGEGTFLQKFLKDISKERESVYPNEALRRVMEKAGVFTTANGFDTIHQIQVNKGLPLPSYDLDATNRIHIILYGKVLDKNYTRLLKNRKDLDLHTIFLLDKVQKQEYISKEDYQMLRKKSLVEGRYPNIFVSYKIAGATGLKTNYVKNKGLGDDVYKKVLINALQTMGSANVRELFVVLKGALPDVMDKKQQARKISNLLQALKKQGIVKSKGTGQSAKWYLVK